MSMFMLAVESRESSFPLHFHETDRPDMKKMKMKMNMKMKMKMEMREYNFFNGCFMPQRHSK